MAERPTSNKKKSSQCLLIVKNGEIGLMRQGSFQPHTNFYMDIVHAVESPKNAPRLYGIVFLVKSINGFAR